MTWKKIETAPKDGTWVLVCNKNHYYPETAAFKTYHPNAQGKATWRTKSMGTKIYPTHWMPLPDLDSNFEDGLLGAMVEFVREQVEAQREQLIKDQVNWLMLNTSLEVEKIVDFEMIFKQFPESPSQTPIQNETK